MKYDLVIFDMDGTVLDTLEDLLAAMNHALAKHGLPVHTLDEMRTYVGNGLYMMAARAVPAETDKALTDSVFNEFKAYYAGHLNVLTKPYPGIVDMLKKLKDAGINAGISSNKFDLGAKGLSDTHFGDLVGLTVGESDQVPKKPDPTGTEIIIKHFGVSKQRTVYVGDSGVDVETARNAGLNMIAVTWGFRTRAQLEQAGATVFAGSVSELENLLMSQDG